MTERRDQIISHPRAKGRERLAAYLADHCTALPAPVAIAALSGAVRDLDDTAAAVDTSDEDAQRAGITALGASVFEARRQQSRPADAPPPAAGSLPDPESVFASRRQDAGGAA